MKPETEKIIKDHLYRVDLSCFLVSKHILVSLIKQQLIFKLAGKKGEYLYFEGN